jgi:hypothetical protein
MKGKKIKFVFDEKKILEKVKRQETFELKNVLKHNIQKNEKIYSRKIKHKGKNPYA